MDPIHKCATDFLALLFTPPWCIDASSSMPVDVLVPPALAPNTMTQTFLFAPRSPMNYSPDR